MFLTQNVKRMVEIKAPSIKDSILAVNISLLFDV
jgi:hypothetical protein